MGSQSMKEVGEMIKGYKIEHGKGGVFNQGKNKEKVRHGLQG